MDLEELSFTLSLDRRIWRGLSDSLLSGPLYSPLKARSGLEEADLRVPAGSQ